MKFDSGIDNRIKRFGSIFLAVFVIALCNRYLSLTAYARFAYGETYNAAAGFNPVAAFFSTKAEVLWLGVALDILFCVTFALIFTFIRGPLLTLAIVILSLFYAANIEHVKANLTAIDLNLIGFATDPTFVRAQFTWDVAVYTILFSAWALALLRIERIAILTRSCALAALALTAAAVAYAPNSFRITEPAWLQSHPLFPSLGHKSLTVSNRTFEETAFARADLPELGPDRLNVLLVYLEGLSNFSRTKAEMDVLNDLADRNIMFERFIGHQLITSNGLYTSLTGDLPRFIGSERKWNELSEGDGAKMAALPAVLSEAGYHTAFLQSADLTFMSKGEHLKDLGFEEARGDTNWSDGPGVHRNGWGIDDRSLFRNVVDYIDDLETAQPWFISVLTTGTHAPYNVPEEFLAEESSARFRSLKYVDAAIAELMQELENRNLLENTVVIFTADESRESSNLASLNNEILLNWLPFVAIHPSQKQLSVSQVVTGKKTRNLVLELSTNSADPDLQPVIGDIEPILFGNVISGRIFWFDPKTQDFFACLNGPQLGCEHWSGVVDVTHPTKGAKVEQAYFPGLQDVILEHEQ